MTRANLPLTEWRRDCPTSGRWTMTLLFSVLRRCASWQSHNDDRQGQNGKAHARIQPPPQATDQGFWAASLTAQCNRGGRDYRGDHPQPPGVTQLHGVFNRPAASPRSSSPVLPLPTIVRGTFESMNPPSPITIPKSTKIRPPPKDIGVINSSPTPTSARPKDAVVLTPNLVTNRPARGAATTEARVIGMKRSPAVRALWPNTSWR